MSLPHQSVKTVDNVEFVNLTPMDINPGVSQCEIKTFYVGENRNKSYISKEVATEMAKTIRGCPIVGYYKKDKGDFTDHGEKITIDGDGIHFECMTKPYGFVAPDARVWFKKFSEKDDFGNDVEREYLMTTGYLWTKQYEEAQQVVDDSKPQSMELDGESVQGHWAENSKNGMEFFIINDAVISKLCILGDDVEPCFEGASITKPDISSSFTLDDNFKTTLFDMMKELEFALKGEKTVVKEENKAPVTEEVQKPAEEFSAQKTEGEAKPETQMTEEKTENASSSDFAEKKPEEEEKTADPAEKDSSPAAAADDEKKKPETKNSLHTDEEYEALETKYNELETKFNEMSAEQNKLIDFKNTIEDKQKDELIAKFYMLDDADKKDVIENKRNYSLDDIESKLAVICYRKKINFTDTSDDNNDNEAKDNNTIPSVIFNMNDANTGSTTDDWVTAVEANQNTI